MTNGQIAADRACGSLGGAVDAIDRLPLDRLEPAAGVRLLLTLRGAIDRLEGSFARVAAVVDESGEWRSTGASSMAAWVANTTGMARGRARSAVELGQAMADEPALDSAVRSGEVSPAAARAVIPAMGDDGFACAAADLIRELTRMTPTAAARHVEAWRAVTNPAGDSDRRTAARAGRTLQFRPLGDGMTHVEGVVPDDMARSLRQALAHLADQQRLDGSGRTRDQRRVDALGDLVAAYNRGEVTGGRNLPRVIVTSTLDDFEARGVGRDSFSGEVVTSAEIDRLCCDAIIHRYVADQDGAPLNFGRGRRTASPHQFLAMVARDRGCRHPGCDRPPQWCEAHHLREFAARGGLTDLDEMVLLCHHHHHALHDGGWTMTGDPTHLIFSGPGGRRLEGLLPQHGTKRAA